MRAQSLETNLHSLLGNASISEMILATMLLG